MKTWKCQYCPDKILTESDRVVEISGDVKKSYHKECFEQRNAKAKALDLFYQYTGSLVMQNMVYLAFKKAREKGLTDKDILYTMEYIIKTKSVLNYPMGILYYLDRAMKEKAEQEKRDKQDDATFKGLYFC